MMRILPTLALAAALLLPGLAHAQDDQTVDAAARVFPDTGFQITDDAIWSFFDAHGGAATFGEPISREFSLAGSPIQIFQNAVLRVVDDGLIQVQVLQLTDPSLLPYTHLDGLTIPAADPSVAFVAPTPDQPNYAARLQGYLEGVVSSQLLQTYLDQGGADVWGMPTSFAVFDPNNPRFLYQRFQNGVLFYDGATGTTRALPLGTYFKAVLTEENLPSDLASEAVTSPFLGLAHSSADLSGAFVPDA